MKFFDAKIAGFITWLKNSAENPGDDPLYKIPTLGLFRQYQLESDTPIEDLTDAEREYLETYSENLIFSLASKGVIRSDLGKFFLEAQRGWSAKQTPQDAGPVDFVSFDFGGLNTENTATHDNLNLENEAVTALIKEKGLQK